MDLNARIGRYEDYNFTIYKKKYFINFDRKLSHRAKNSDQKFSTNGIGIKHNWGGFRGCSKVAHIIYRGSVSQQLTAEAWRYISPKVTLRENLILHISWTNFLWLRLLNQIRFLSVLDIPMLDVNNCMILLIRALFS